MYDAQAQHVSHVIGTSVGGDTGSRSSHFADVLQGQLLDEYTLKGTQYKPVIEYIWLEDQPVAAVRPTPGAPANGGNSAQEVFYLHTDHLGTPRVALDTAGRVRWRWMGGEPFGVNPAENNPEGLGELNLSLRLPGQQYDGFVGLHYNYFRDYDPTVGRYVQSDPIGLEGGNNTYAYVESNPLSYTDLDGLQVIRPRPGLPGFPAPGRPPGGMRDPDFPPGVGPNQSPGPTPPSWSRDIWWPDRKTGQWSCKARADCNDNIPGNCPEEPSKRFSFGGGTANDLGTARNVAKANATANLQCQPKHVSCKCTGPKGEQYSGGC
ncbi:RHS repeat domain-containing protein [Roseateles sp.]|uniref:RHS repeat domain-containing protein n=1 Tax=Roseateles sp. TaxID=1971397 RepID=UPI003D15008D